MLRGRSVKLIPTKEQESLFIRFCGARRFAYNWALSEEMKAFENGNRFISQIDLNKKITALKKSDPDFMWLKDISCDVVKQAIKDCECAYKMFFSMQKKSGYKKFTDNTIRRSKYTGKHLTEYDMNGHPKYKKLNKCQKSFHLDCCKIRIIDNYVLIPKIGYVKIACNNVFPKGKSGIDFKIANAKVKFDGKYWILVGSMGNNIIPLTNKKSDPIGIDLGIKYTAILSDGTKYKNINKSKKIKRLERRRNRLNKRLSKKYKTSSSDAGFKKSKNIEKIEQQIQNVERRLRGIRNNYRHQITTEIVKRNPIFIVVEDLNVIGLMKNKHVSKAFSDQGLNYILSYLSYKCNQWNISMIKANRFYPSSKKCSRCGYIKKDLKLNDRQYLCSNCGLSIDRDINAAINLKNYGIENIEK